MLGATPFIEGMLFKQHYLNLVSAINNSKQGLTLQVLDYHVGWLNSTANVSIHFDIPHSTQSSPHSLILIQRIAHGPFLRDPLSGNRIFAEAVIQSQLYLDEKSAKLLFGNGTPSSIMQINTIASFQGHFHNQFQTLSFSITSPRGIKLNWQGLRGTVSMDVIHAYVATLKDDITIGKFSLEDETHAFSVANMAAHHHANCDEDSLCSGSGDASITEIAYKAHPHNNLQIANIISNYDGKNINNLYTTSFQITLNNLVTADYTVNLANLKFNIANLNTPAIKKFLNSIKNSDNIAPADISRQLLDILNPQTIVSADTTITTSLGNLTSTAKLFWPENAPLPKNPVELAQKVNFQITIRASRTLIEQVIKWLDVQRTPSKPSQENIISPPPAFQSSMTAIVQFKTQLAFLLQQKQIPESVSATFLTLQQHNQLPQNFNSYTKHFVDQKMIAPATALRIEKLYAAAFAEQQNNNILLIFTTPAKIQTDLQTKIYTLAQQNIISQTIAQQLIELQNQSVAPEIYSMAITQLVNEGTLSREVGTQLSAQYLSINKDLSVTHGEDENGSSNTLEELPPSAAPNGSQPTVKTTFDAWVQQGYISQNNDDYVTSITYQEGILKINGMEISNMIQMMNYRNVSANFSNIIRNSFNS